MFYIPSFLDFVNLEEIYSNIILDHKLIRATIDWSEYWDDALEIENILNSHFKHDEK